jgi:hypothetical protein
LAFLLKPIEAGKRRHRIKEKLHEHFVSSARRSRRRRRMKPFEGFSLTSCHSLASHMEHLSKHLFDIDGARGSCRPRFFYSLSLSRSSTASHKYSSESRCSSEVVNFPREKSNFRVRPEMQRRRLPCIQHQFDFIAFARIASLVGLEKGNRRP